MPFQTMIGIPQCFDNATDKVRAISCDRRVTEWNVMEGRDLVANTRSRKQ